MMVVRRVLVAAVHCEVALRRVRTVNPNFSHSRVGALAECVRVGDDDFGARKNLKQKQVLLQCQASAYHRAFNKLGTPTTTFHSRLIRTLSHNYANSDWIAQSDVPASAPS